VVLPDIQGKPIMRLDAHCQILDRVVSFSQAGITLGNPVGRQLPLFIEPDSFGEKRLLQAAFAACGKPSRLRCFG
jgi:hypothetical protein